MTSPKPQSKSKASKQPSAKKSPKKAPAAALPAKARPAPRAERPQTPSAGVPKAAASRVEPNETSVAGELSTEVMEFINAIDEYKRQRRRPFPNWSEIFEIVKALGYNKSA